MLDVGLKRAALIFIFVTMGLVVVVQIIACASDAYYPNSKYNKPEWAIIFGLLLGKASDVKHSAPKDVKFFSETTNILFVFGGHVISVEIMHAIWQPSSIFRSSANV